MMWWEWIKYWSVRGKICGTRGDFARLGLMSDGERAKRFGETKRYLKGLREVRTNGRGRTETD